MSVKEHLTSEQIAAFVAHRNRLEVDEHLTECAQCRERLSQYWNADLGFRRQAASEVDDESSHLDYDQLEAYMDGKMTPAEHAAADAHTKVCPACARGLRDLKSFKDELNSEHEAGKLVKPGLAWARPAWPAMARIAATVLVAAGIAVLFLWKKNNNHPLPPEPGDQLSQDIAALQPGEQRAVRETLTDAKVTLPPELAELRPTQDTLRKLPAQSRHFLLLSPVGEVINDPQPLFQWQPLAGAQSYTVDILGPDSNSVQSSPSLRETQWKPQQPLRRGYVYQWQVTALMKNGAQVLSPKPPAPEAKFRVLEASQAEQIEQFQLSHPRSHLVLGILYARVGMLTAAANELRQVAQNDANYGSAQGLLKSIEKEQKAE
jgi:hypothetical protein